ncbi:uncharacterized protein LOC111010475 [Momordica charantia]|uniref:Uncharacterized protein LOC111010475 n=1 Tax=Momordica charantia TaxID=3673 RepID=A0A6J1CEG4_MOMCH|nr:uncharacterized protein LOC111010475 [Momordica charantia]
MEVPVLNRITELGADLSSLPNANFLSRILTSFSPSQHFWKWGAVVIALLATFSGLINRVKILIIVIRRRRTTPIYEPLSRSLHGGENGGFVSENLGSPPFFSSESEDENELSSPEDGSDFGVKGSGRSSDDYSCGRRCSGLRRRHYGGDSLSWSCFGSERSVVRQWGEVQLKCKFDELSGSVISLYDENEEKEICSIFSGGAPVRAAAMSPAGMVVSAGQSVFGNVSVKLWDTRSRSQTPIVAAEWNSPAAKIVDVYYEESEKVYLRNDSDAKLTVADVRKVCSALENSNLGGVDRWWHAKA